MAELKTKPTEASVEKFLSTISDETVRADCRKIAELMRKATRAKPKMWGESIVGFGDYHYKSASGREGDWFKLGFSPRKNNLTLYVLGCLGEHEPLLKQLGKHKSGKGCLYLKRLEDVDISVLKALLARSLKALEKLSR